MTDPLDPRSPAAPPHVSAEPHPTARLDSPTGPPDPATGAARDSLTFHHVGVACRAIEPEEPVFAALGFVPEGDPFRDENQGIRGRFMVGGGMRVELLEELPGSGVLAPWLAARVKTYHHAYLVADLRAGIARLEAGGAHVVKPPAPAPAFDGRQVAFVMLPNLLLVELVEAPG